ncbi:NAD(P)/FAD-dependent oxidoreductase [Granulicella arctica]|uniref:hypothetical protein n=1 Tax=Granulicella arctica TaxID=940613 RepID=UPI0021E05A6C|nr:hypothetical protein [Granulicella arctica]
MEASKALQIPDPSVTVEGDGIASACVARLLSDASVPFTRQPRPGPRLPAILLGQQTRHLLQELFPPLDSSAPNLFDGLPRITRRIVLWGSAAVPIDLPHQGIVAPEAELLDCLWNRVPDPRSPAGTAHSHWHLRSSRTSSAPLPEQSFGTRIGRIAQVELSSSVIPEACWVESVDGGWLFLLPLGQGRAALIAVGDTVEQLLGTSRLIAPLIVRALSVSPPIPVAPRLARSLASPGTIACGTAAMGFDPLCGEGAGNAVREAFLAAACIRAAHQGFNPDQLAEHYTTRLKQGFLRHLQTCLPFYATGGTGEFWHSETRLLELGIQQLQTELASLPPPRFRLMDRDLLPLPA